MFALQERHLKGCDVTNKGRMPSQIFCNYSGLKVLFQIPKSEFYLT